MATEADEDVPEFLDTAGTHVVRDVAVFTPGTRADAARRALVGRTYGTLVDVAVCEDDPDGTRRLRGLVRVERLFGADPEAPLLDLADTDPPVVAPGVDQEVAAWHAVEHGDSSLAVADDTGHFVGLVPPRVMLQVLLAEHDEDMARIGGFLARSSGARLAAVEPVPRRFTHRMPWLLLGLAGALASAALVSSFEAQLDAHVALAFFLPGIVYMAAAVGTQTETLVIRGLSVGVRIRGIAGREAVTGVLVGAAVAVLFLPVTLAVSDTRIAVTASLALFAACATASVIAMALPWLLARLGRDPAFGSGPVATLAQDLVSLTLYLSIARVVVG
jgi:magnesium transporter